jgi:RNA polymerase sigma-70 factor (ECF subfamily)
MQPAQQPGIFPDTRWSLILQLRMPKDKESVAEALNELCRAYWQPLYIYLRRSGREAEAAKDSVQGFLAYFLSKRGFERIGPTDGRFRHFLLGALRNYLVSEARKEQAVKRGGEADVVPLDVEQAEEVFRAEAAESLSAEAAFDRQWAQTVWTQALRRLRQEQVLRGKEQAFEALKPYLAEEAKRGNAHVAAQAGLSPSAVAVAVHRLRRRLRELVLEELAQTVGTKSDLDNELNYFLSIWGK